MPAGHGRARASSAASSRSTTSGPASRRSPYLSRLAVGELKLDRTFLSGLVAATTASRDLALVRATIELAHTLGLRVVAEGVEERTTLELLRTVGCDLAQGYHIGRPTPATAISFRADLAA